MLPSLIQQGSHIPQGDHIPQGGYIPQGSHILQGSHVPPSQQGIGQVVIPQQFTNTSNEILRYLRKDGQCI